MMNDKTHPQWQAADLEAKVKCYLGRKYDSFLETAKDIRGAIDGLVGKLAVFSQPESAAHLSTSARDASRIAFKKQEYIESLEFLKESNAELRRIRQTANEVRGCHTAVTPLPAVLTPLPPIYEHTRNISLFLHDLLRKRSSCNITVHTSHCARLILSSMDETEGRINLFFERISSKGTGLIHQRDLLPIHTSCKNSGYTNSNRLTPNSIPVGELFSTLRQVSDENPIPHFIIPQPNNTYSDDFGDYDGEDLSKIRIKCEQLTRSSTAAGRKSPRRSLGYLPINDNQKLVLRQGLRGLNYNDDGLELLKTTPLLDFLKLPVFDVASDQDRIRLGITLVKSMLKHHSTPWWPRGCALGHIYVFREASIDLTSCLDTLHLSTPLKPVPSTTGDTAPIIISSDEEDCQPDFLPLESVQDAMDTYGIRNLTLYCLGVALLQIGLWDPQEYRNAIKRLIYCDFGLAEEELQDPELQRAIFHHVVGDLESLLHKLTCAGL
ncbi:hypothetical protein F4677DRAFT_466126 [Hypoxylon crocopeplum]|nr:hypothetical protein F4677DRAFT_466126 [Hypoxylon crocopeplum]